MAGFDPDQSRDPHGRWNSNGSNASNAVAYGVAGTLVASAIAGGSLSGAASASGSLAESGIPRISRSQSQVRTSITDITSDTVRATIRL